MWDKFKEFVAERLNEASTKRALTILFGFIGWQVAPEHADLIAQVVVASLVMFGILPDKKKTEAEKALEAKTLQEAKEAAAREVLGLDPK